MEKFLRTSVSPDARKHQIIASAPAFNKIAAAGKLRQGMWVVVDNKVGILTALGADGKAEVMLVRADGSDLIVALADAAAVSQASFDDIPEKRRPPLAAALAFGYARKRNF